MRVKLVPSKEDKTTIQKRRDEIREEHWPGELAWLAIGRPEKGFFRGPRSLPYILAVLRSKGVSERKDPSSVYVELLARHMGEGVVLMSAEEDHAFAAGYTGTRATRTWRERMAILEEHGFIKSIERGNLRYGVVFIVHPSLTLKALHDSKKVSKRLWDAYRLRQMETAETKYEVLMPAESKKNKSA